jgi:hypothetical protein
MTNSNSSNNTSSNDVYRETANTLGTSINQWAGQIAADNLANEQRRQEREEAREIREAEAALLKANYLKLVNSRKTLIAKYPDGKTPLSHQVKDANEVYYFTYSYSPATIETNSPIIHISNVFPLSKYGDGTWPFKASLMEKISKTNPGLELILSGYYLTKSEADRQQQLLFFGARDYGFVIKNIAYEGKKSTQTSGSTSDYWGNTNEGEGEKTVIEKEAPKTNNSNVDYWGNPVKKEEQKVEPNKKTEPTKKQEPTKPKVKYDYWGNPIKE